MSNVKPFPDDKAAEAIERLEKAKLSKNGGPPYDGNMESRVAKLELFAKDAGERLVRVETKLDHIDREVSQFKWWAAGSAVAVVLAMIATVLGTGVAIQQMTVASFQAAGQQGQASQQPIIITVPGTAPTQASPALKP